MRITQQLDDLSIEGCPVTLAVGSFDGIHRGHQLVIGLAVEMARQADGENDGTALQAEVVQLLRDSHRFI